MTDTLYNFNSHAHVERDLLISRLSHSNSNFNSHAHVERDIDRVAFGAETAISTHTLTWSVTVCVCVHFFGLIISTHTLTWSVTKFPQDHRKF